MSLAAALAFRFANHSCHPCAASNASAPITAPSRPVSKRATLPPRTPIASTPRTALAADAIVSTELSQSLAFQRRPNCSIELTHCKQSTAFTQRNVTRRSRSSSGRTRSRCCLSPFACPRSVDPQIGLPVGQSSVDHRIQPHAISPRAALAIAHMVAWDRDNRRDCRGGPHRRGVLPIRLLLRGQADRRRPVVSAGLRSQSLAHAIGELLAPAVLAGASPFSSGRTSVP